MIHKLREAEDINEFVRNLSHGDLIDLSLGDLEDDPYEMMRMVKAKRELVYTMALYYMSLEDHFSDQSRALIFTFLPFED